MGRVGRRAAAVLVSKGLKEPIPDRVTTSLKEARFEPVAWIEVSDNDIESSARLFADLPGNVSAVVGVGRGRVPRRHVRAAYQGDVRCSDPAGIPAFTLSHPAGDAFTSSWNERRCAHAIQLSGAQ